MQIRYYLGLGRFDPLIEDLIVVCKGIYVSFELVEGDFGGFG